MAHSHPNASAGASSAAPTSASSSYLNYEVFINYPGPDVKKTFGVPLYRRLISHGLRVLLSELDVGHNVASRIEEAIGVASVHVAIFSQTYPQSKGSLDELVLMLESGRTIVPVFYGVQPSDLRWTGIDNDGVFAEALRNHEQKKPRSSVNTIQIWRNALSRVADISGFSLAACNWDEGKLLDKVVQTVLKKVPKTPLDVAKYPIGLVEKMEDFEKLVLSEQEEEHSEAKAVGIVGAQGVGKTTLAKHFFNYKRSEYSGSSFIFDMRENASKMSLNYLQKKLIKDLKPIHTKNVSAEGDVEIIKDLKHINTKIESGERVVETLKEIVTACHALIILDDVDHPNQLDAFLPIRKTLNPESLILITSRDKGVLTKVGVEESSIYRLEGLNRSQSRQLFCFHAFSHPYPLGEFQDLVDEFLSVCDGLPLSLKVLGSLLYGVNDIVYWKKQLDKLWPTEIHNRLRISYDSLDHEEQQIFLDIACFFIGEDRDTALRIWDGSGWKSLLVLRSLENKCLIEVDYENKIRMHDHLRDLGRDIAERNSMPRRLWHPVKNLQDLHDLLERSSSRSVSILPTFGCANNVRDLLFRVICHMPCIQVIPTDVRGIKMSRGYTLGDSGKEGLSQWNKSSSDESSSDEVFEISKLQLLEAQGEFVENILTCVLSPNLIWLRWNECPCSSLPSCIPMRDLRVLEVAGRKLEKLWQREYEAPLQLRELNIDAPLLEFPKSLAQLKYLEKIVLNHTEVEGMHSATLPEAFCCLRSLKHFELKWCQKLQILPSSFGNLINLQLFDLSYCKTLKMLPESFGKLTNLQSIHLSMCESLEKLSFSFENLTSLQRIDLSYCKRLKTLPDSIGNLINLQHISMRRCESLGMLTNSVGSLTNLQYMDLSWCKSLKLLPESVGNLLQLKHLHLKGCCNLTISNRSLGNITTLQCLDLEGCLQVAKLPPQIGRQQSLQRLNLMGTELKELRNDVGHLSKLEVLSLGSHLLKMLPSSLGNLTSLKELVLHGCKKLQCLPDSVGLLTRLAEMNIVKCGIQYLPPAVVKLNSLKILRVHCCPLRELPFNEVEESRGQRAWSELQNKGMSQLRELELYRTEISEVFFPKGVFRHLQDLTIVSCNDLVEVGALPRTLVTIDIRYCSALKKIGGLHGLPSLKKLDMRGCNNIQVEELQGLAKTLKFPKEVGTPLHDRAEETETEWQTECALLERKWLKTFCEDEEILQIQ